MQRRDRANNTNTGAETLDMGSAEKNIKCEMSCWSGKWIELAMQR